MTDLHGETEVAMRAADTDYQLDMKSAALMAVLMLRWRIQQRGEWSRKSAQSEGLPVPPRSGGLRYAYATSQEGSTGEVWPIHLASSRAILRSRFVCLPSR